jgi:hypothetical protein
MSLTITRSQRDAIYELVSDHLSGIDAVWFAHNGGDATAARRHAHEFAQDFQLLDSLGWTKTVEAETVELTVAPAQLAATLVRLHRDAVASLDSYVSRPKDDEALAQQHLLAAETLGELLGQLADAPTPDGS